MRWSSARGAAPQPTATWSPDRPGVLLDVTRAQIGAPAVPSPRAPRPLRSCDIYCADNAITYGPVRGTPPADISSQCKFKARSEPGRQTVERDQVFGGNARPDQRPFIIANKHFGDEWAAVIGAGLDRTIGAGGHHREEVAGFRLDKRAVEREIVARFANRSDHVRHDSPRARRAFANRANVMKI